MNYFVFKNGIKCIKAIFHPKLNNIIPLASKSSNSYFCRNKLQLNISGNHPLLTVLMPNYNNEKFLNEAIESVLQQSYKDFIFLIIDDGSTDKSTAIIKSYSDLRIKLILKETNTGIEDTLNIGLKEIYTKYFIRMDGDDISLPNRFKLLVEYMENNPDIGVCGTHIKIFGHTNEIWRQELNSDKILAKFIYASGVTHAPSIFRTKVLKDNQIHYRKIFPQLEDYDLFFRLKKITKFKHIDQVLYGYRVLDHNVTVVHRKSQNIRYKEFYKMVLNELQIEATENNLNLHIQYFLNEPLKMPLKHLYEYKNKIISANSSLMVYPEKELLAVTNEKWNSLFFKVTDLNLQTIINYFYLSKKVKIEQLLYLIKCKLNKLFGRK